MSYYQDEFYEDGDGYDEERVDDGCCERCGYWWLDCHCEFEYFSTGECSHCGESYEDCQCHLIDDDGTEAEGVPFA